MVGAVAYTGTITSYRNKEGSRKVEESVPCTWLTAESQVQETLFRSYRG